MVRKLLPRLGLLLGGLLAPLLVLELALRVLGPILPGNYEHGIWRVSHPVYGTFHVTGSTAWTRTPEFTVQLRFNNYGLRGPETTLQKPGGTRRVLLLGDSFVEAKQVP